MKRASLGELFDTARVVAKKIAPLFESDYRPSAVRGLADMPPASAARIKRELERRRMAGDLKKLAGSLGALAARQALLQVQQQDMAVETIAEAILTTARPEVDWPSAPAADRRVAIAQAKAALAVQIRMFE